MRAEGISGPRESNVEGDLELPTNGELHDAAGPRFTQGLLSRGKDAKGSRQISLGNCTQTELPLQERIDGINAESRWARQALRISDVIRFPSQCEPLAFGQVKCLVKTGVDIEIAGESQDVTIAAFTGQRVSPTGE